MSFVSDQGQTAVESMPRSSTTLESTPASSQNHLRRLPQVLIIAAALYWIFQVAWFWRYCGRNINADAISYIGIARHVVDGDFRASLHGYWSPLVSWLVALLSLISNNLTLDARLLMLPAFACCMFLLYRLTYRLWNSRLLAAIAVLWFVMARGIAAFSVSFIGADLILTALVLLYFILLLRCMQKPENLHSWLELGLAHGIAFLAKAIAMPLLVVATLVAAMWSPGRRLLPRFQALIIAAVFPMLIYGSWGIAMRAKYRVFTTGYQLHWNLLDANLRAVQARRAYGMLALRDERRTIDSYSVAESMPPGSPFWQMKTSELHLLLRILRKEAHDLPQASKELLVLLTPGGILALVLCVFQLTQERRRDPVQFRFAWIVLITTAALVTAYCMLVFDGRYVIPITPVLIALAVRFAVPSKWLEGVPQIGSETGHYLAGLQATAGILLMIGLIAVQLYWASPFRNTRQDFQSSVYRAADVLTSIHAGTVVTIGDGPYPEHGVGWEAGYYAAYFASTRVVGDASEVPRSIDTDSVITDIAKLAPDAVIVWGAPSDANCSNLVRRIQDAYRQSDMRPIQDPKKGQVATILLLRSNS